MSKVRPTDMLYANESIAAEGTYLYGGSVECRLLIVRCPVRYGSGDEDDEPEDRDDLNVITYYLHPPREQQTGSWRDRYPAPQ